MVAAIRHAESRSPRNSRSFFLRQRLAGLETFQLTAESCPEGRVECALFAATIRLETSSIIELAPPICCREAMVSGSTLTLSIDFTAALAS